MEPPRSLPALAPHLPFKFVGGRPSLDLLNTADWPATGPAEDRLSSYGRILEWAGEAGILGAAAAVRLRRRAAADPTGAERTLERCRELRRTLHPFSARGAWAPRARAGSRDRRAPPWLARPRRSARRPAVAGRLGRGPALPLRGIVEAPRLRRAGLRVGLRRPEPERAPPLVRDG